MSGTVLKCQAENGVLNIACDDLSNYADQSNSRKKGLYIGVMRNIQTNVGRLAVWLRVAGTDDPVLVRHCPFCGVNIHPASKSQVEKS